MVPTSPLARRTRRPELMDDPALAEPLHRAALRGLARLNRWSGAARSFWSRLLPRFEGRSELRLLDVGCGGGDVLVDLVKRAEREGLRVRAVAADLSERALSVVRERARAEGVELETRQVDALRDGLPAGADVVLSSLFLHHLSDDDARRLLERMAAAAGEAVLVQDLDRSLAGLSLAHVATRALTRSPIVHHDGPVSVQQAFTRAEILALAEQAGLRGAVARPCFPCRWMLSWERPA